MTRQQSRDIRPDLARKHLAAGFDAYEQAGACFVVTPFLRRDNDHVAVRVDEQSDGRFVITDGGETVGYLRMSAHAVRDNPALQAQLHSIESSFGVRVEDEEILLETDESGFAQALATVARAAQQASHLGATT
ncbi:MAG: DUF1828 domain-containing protein [Chloroflexi bacterium]|nr:DUF1828 domain-containing protein [Chloroflexota bacterium]MYD65237.1 DUF1828 domain-containing protein [Chloroflexota bacterium]